MSADLLKRQEICGSLWQAGLSGGELLARQTDLVDAFVVERFQASEAVRAAGGGIALIALGGYGRRELHPYSDIDLLLLHGGQQPGQQRRGQKGGSTLCECGG